MNDYDASKRKETHRTRSIIRIKTAN